jgi:pSer/pThr/pTyr-binding forkhead associated (FHA) protein
MFSLEISFKDGVSQKETVMVRRPQALIGAQDVAHVVIMDMRALDYQIRIGKEIGRKFRVVIVPNQEGGGIQAKPLEGTYDEEVSLDLGVLDLKIISLDSDLILRDDETPDTAGVRVLRQSCGSPSPLFPAVVVQGAVPLVVSFSPGHPILVGRSKSCALRLDNAEISSSHARIGYEGGDFWVEDLGSTNGTFVENQQVSGRVDVPAGTPITLGRDIIIIGVTSNDQITRASRRENIAPGPRASLQTRYPALISVSEVARPARLTIPQGATLKVGRDQTSDMWLGAPHISRMHCTVGLTDDGEVVVNDYSTNGTRYDGGLLRRGDVLALAGKARVFDFGASVTLGICFSEEDERLFLESKGAPDVFKRQSDSSRSIIREAHVAVEGEGALPPELSTGSAPVEPIVAHPKGTPLVFGRFGLIIATTAFMMILFILINIWKK